MSTIIINGTRYDVQGGKNICVENNKIKVDGIIIETGELNGIVEIKFEGDIANLEAHNVKVKGNVLGNVDTHNIECGDVQGDVKAHNVNCGNIGGNVNAKNISR